MASGVPSRESWPLTQASSRQPLAHGAPLVPLSHSPVSLPAGEATFHPCPGPAQSSSVPKSWPQGPPQHQASTLPGLLASRGGLSSGSPAKARVGSSSLWVRVSWGLPSASGCTE